MSATKIRIKIGPIEVEYEGTEAFLKDELPAILSGIAQLHKASGGRHALGTGGNGDSDPTLTQTTTGSIAAKLNAKTGTEVALAAAAYLGLVQEKASFSRQELLDAMKTAAGRYKQSMAANFSKYLARLTKDGKLVSPGNEMYSLDAGAAADLRKQLAAN